VLVVLLLTSATFAVAAVTPAPNAAASPSPSPRATLSTIGTTATASRSTNLVGTADSASAGTIGAEQIATRPLLRPGELLEQIPGLVISQHSGEGKANQYYLRGFQLDHGTDLEGTVDDVPVNMPTHAHGQGYSDINWLIPELVQYVSFEKGPYYADEGDFATAGSYDLTYRDTIAPIEEFAIGDYGYDRYLVAGSRSAGGGNLLGAFEYDRDNGTFISPDEYEKFNGVLRWSRQTANSYVDVDAMAYHGAFDSTDQIPQRLVDAGVLNRYSAFDPSDGGTTDRYVLDGKWVHADAEGVSQVSAFGELYGLDLFSDFTYDLDDATDYYNVTANPVTCNPLYTTCKPGANHVGSYVSYCPANDTPTGGATVAGSVSPAPFTYACGDQREQLDQRFVTGLTAKRTYTSRLFETTIGTGFRNDNIPVVGLFLTSDRLRYPEGTLSDDHVAEFDQFLWLQSQYRIGPRLRLIGGVREDAYRIDVQAYLPGNSGLVHAALVSPKLMAAYAFDRHQELYVDAGDGFHSNDGRETTQTLDPQTHADIDPSGDPVTKYSPLNRAQGSEVGYRYSNGLLTSTVSAWQLHMNSELVFDGDNGTTAPAGPTIRRGLEFANFYTPDHWLTLDLDVATSTARFTSNFNGQGTYVPESLNAVTSAGITLDRPAFAASLRYRYFGPRALDQAGDAFSTPSNIVNLQLTRKLPRGRRLTLDVLNLFDNTQADDVEYYYQSWVPQDALNPAYAKDPAINPLLGGQGVNDYHFHPTERRIVRLSYALPL